jgi:hypothetical protein
MITQVLNISANNMSVVSLGFGELSGWTARVQIEISRGTLLSINGRSIMLDRMREYFDFTFSQEKAQQLFGENYAAILTAVQTGDYVPGGDVAVALIAEAMAQLGE